MISSMEIPNQPEPKPGASKPGVSAVKIFLWAWVAKEILSVLTYLAFTIVFSRELGFDSVEGSWSAMDWLQLISIVGTVGGLIGMGVCVYGLLAYLPVSRRQRAGQLAKGALAGCLVALVWSVFSFVVHLALSEGAPAGSTWASLIVVAAMAAAGARTSAAIATRLACFITFLTVPSISSSFFQLYRFERGPRSSRPSLHCPGRCKDPTGVHTVRICLTSAHYKVLHEKSEESTTSKRPDTEGYAISPFSDRFRMSGCAIHDTKAEAPHPTQ